jgi:hypothetical protein
VELVKTLGSPPFDRMTQRAVEEGVNALLPAEVLSRAVEPGTHTVREWAALLGATAEEVPESALTERVASRARTVDELLYDLGRAQHLVLVRSADRLLLVDLDRAAAHLRGKD